MKGILGHVDVPERVDCDGPRVVPGVVCTHQLSHIAAGHTLHDLIVASIHQEDLPMGIERQTLRNQEVARGVVAGAGSPPLHLGAGWVILVDVPRVAGHIDVAGRVHRYALRGLDIDEDCGRAAADAEVVLHHAAIA